MLFLNQTHQRHLHMVHQQLQSHHQSQLIHQIDLLHLHYMHQDLILYILNYQQLHLKHHICILCQNLDRRHRFHILHLQLPSYQISQQRRHNYHLLMFQVDLDYLTDSLMQNFANHLSLEYYMHILHHLCLYHYCLLLDIQQII